MQALVVARALVALLQLQAHGSLDHVGQIAQAAVDQLPQAFQQLRVDVRLPETILEGLHLFGQTAESHRLRHAVAVAPFLKGPLYVLHLRRLRRGAQQPLEFAGVVAQQLFRQFRKVDVEVVDQVAERVEQFLKRGVVELHVVHERRRILFQRFSECTEVEVEQFIVNGAIDAPFDHRCAQRVLQQLAVGKADLGDGPERVQVLRHRRAQAVFTQQRRELDDLVVHDPTDPCRRLPPRRRAASRPQCRRSLDGSTLAGSASSFAFCFCR